MARSTITPSNPTSAHHFIAALPLPLFFIVCVAAIVAVVGALCGSHHIWGEKSEKRTKKKNVEETASTVAPSKLTSSATAPLLEGRKGGVVQEGDAQQRLKEIKVVSQAHKIEAPESLLYPLPLPAGSMSGRSVLPVSPMSRPASSHRRISKSLSVKLPGFSRIRSTKATDECIWKKAIILGEKCRVPGEDGDEAVLYDEKGNRVVAYAARTPRSVPVSRTPSFIDTSAIPRQYS